MTKIGLNTEPQTTFLLTKKAEENKKADYITIPFVKDSVQKDFLPVLKPVVPEKVQTQNVENPTTTPVKPSIKDIYETIVPNIDAVVKKTGLSPKCITRMIKMEGLLLKEYKDEAGNRTIGIGHNINADSNYSYGKEITNEIALDIFTKDLTRSQKSLDSILGDQKLKQGQKEALLDMVFNMGAGKFKNTELLKLVKEKHFDEAAKGFYIIGAGNKVSPFLCRRRIENITRFCEETPSLQAITTMKNIYHKGVAAYDVKIKKCTNPFEKLKYKYKKNVFMTEAQGFINETTALYNKTTKQAENKK